MGSWRLVEWKPSDGDGRPDDDRDDAAYWGRFGLVREFWTEDPRWLYPLWSVSVRHGREEGRVRAGVGFKRHPGAWWSEPDDIPVHVAGRLAAVIGIALNRLALDKQSSGSARR